MKVEYEHEMISVVGTNQLYCVRCGAMPGWYDYSLPCTIAPEGNKEELNKNSNAQKIDSLTEALRESPFDRMDRIFRNK